MTTTTTTVNVNIALMWQTGHLFEADIDNWDEALDNISTTVCPFTVSYNHVTYTGFIAKSLDESRLLVAFDDTEVIIPAGACIIVTCDDGVVETEDHTHCYDNQVILAANTRLAVLDSNGCPIGFVIMQQLTDYLTTELNIPTSLCDLLGVTEIHQGNLVGGDRILTTQGGCTLKSVPQSDVICP